MNKFRLMVIFYLVFITGTVAATWYIQTQSINQLQQQVASLQPIPSSTMFPNTNTPSQISTTSATPRTSTNALETKLNTLSKRVDSLEGIPTPTQVKNAATKPQAFQKQILTLGSWSSIRQEWTKTGLEITINSSDYPDTVNATFEAGLNIVNGIAWARVTNKTNGAIMNITEVSNDTNTVIWKTSPTFKLHPGSNTYVVELKSTSGEVAYLSNSRLILDD